MCGALTTSSPSAEKRAQLKSSRSFTFVETEVRCSVTPICSAIEAKRLLKISSWTGSTSVVATFVRQPPRVRSAALLATKIVARKPGSTTTVEVGSHTMAGPSNSSPGECSSRTKIGVACGLPSNQVSVVVDGTGRRRTGSTTESGGSGSVPTISTRAATISSGRPSRR